MIATLEGTVARKDTDHLVILVGGVGVEVFAPYTTIEKIASDRAFLYTRLIVREDSLALYGFATESERGLFDVLVKISGIGPKLAVTVLGSLSVDSIRSAVLSERPEMLTRVPRHRQKNRPKNHLRTARQVPARFGRAARRRFQQHQFGCHGCPDRARLQHYRSADSHSGHPRRRPRKCRGSGFDRLAASRKLTGDSYARNLDWQTNSGA